MKQQLFLFDDTAEPDDKKEAAVANALTSLVTEAKTDEAEELAAHDFEEPSLFSKKEAETVINPFAEVERQQQDKIDTLLLMPNRKRGRKSFKDMDEEAILIEVPEDEVLFKKQYYPTRIVAEWFGITQSQLRAWETEFDILEPRKNSKGDRFFRPEDVKNLKLIYHLIRRRKFTVQGAKQYLKENKKNLQTTLRLTESLQKFKQFLLELKAISE